MRNDIVLEATQNDPVVLSRHGPKHTAPIYTQNCDQKLALRAVWGEQQFQTSSVVAAQIITVLNCLTGSVIERNENHVRAYRDRQTDQFI